MFVVAGAFHEAVHSQTPVLKMQATLKNSGISITLTTLTTCFGIALGFTSEFMAVRDFCVYASFGNKLLLLFTFTYFIIEIHR